MTLKPYVVMISSTYTELEVQRRYLLTEMHRERFTATVMENDAAVPDTDLIKSSLDKVDEANAYIGILGYRYGQTPDCSERNPDGLSLTELEFNRAVARGIPISILLMDEAYSVPFLEAMKAAASSDKLMAFREKVRRGRIWKSFKDDDEFKVQVSKSLEALRKALEAREDRPATAALGMMSDRSGLSIPPALCARPPYAPGYAFVGRKGELALLRDWARSPDPVLVFDAIGGMGKSMLTWEWINQLDGEDDATWAGKIWYSFYERGANMRDFCITALAYITQCPLDAFGYDKASNLIPRLVSHLRTQRWLIVLDGLERVLVAYHRIDAAQIVDGDVESDPDGAARRPTACIRPEDEDLLRSLATARPSKIVASSRLMPRVLLNAADRPIQGVQRVSLEGLRPEDAEEMLRAAGVYGDGLRMQRYLDQQFGGHPLVFGAVAGLILKDFYHPGDFDRWVNDPRSNDGVNLSALDLVQRRTHILLRALDALEPDVRDLLARLAIVSEPVEPEIVELLNPRFEPELAPDATIQLNRDLSTGSPPRSSSMAIRDAQLWLRGALTDLQQRGLLHRDDQSGRFDLHPVVRGVAVGRLNPEQRGRSGSKVADIFSRRAGLSYQNARSLADLANACQVVRAFTLAGMLKEAWSRLDSLQKALYRLELHHEALSLLRPFFPNGWDQPPEVVSDETYFAAEKPYLAAEVAPFLNAIGNHQAAAKLEIFSISLESGSVRSQKMRARLHNLHGTLISLNALAQADEVLVLAGQIVSLFKALKYWDEVESSVWQAIYEAAQAVRLGKVLQARAVLSAWYGDGLTILDRISQLRLRFKLWNLEVQLLEGRLDEAEVAATLSDAVEASEAHAARWAHRIRAKLQLNAGSADDAMVAYH